MNNIDEMVRNLVRTVPADDQLARKAADHARHVLRATTTAKTARKRPPRSHVPGRRGGRLLPLTTLAAVGAAVGIVLLISQVLVRGGAVRPQPAAAAVLRRAADAALASPPSRLGPGQYWFAENQGTYLDTAGTSHGVLHADVSQVARYWIGARHWQRQDRLVRVRVLGPSTQPWERDGLRAFGANPNIRGTGGSFDLPMPYDRMLNAPVGLTALARFVLSAEVAPGFKARGPARDRALLTAIHDILIEPMVPGRLQAGLFRLAATLRGVHALGLTHDTLGRAALTVGFSDSVHRIQSEFLFDPRSYALLDYRETALTSFGRYIPAGALLQETAFIRAGLVHRAPSTCRECLPAGP